MSSTVEIESPVSADRMFNAAILDWHNLGPRIAPEVLVSVTNEGSVMQLNFTPVMPLSYLEERIDSVDHETFECDSTITKGGHLGTKLESASINYKIVEATAGDGCVIKVVTTTNLIPGIKLEGEAVGIIYNAQEAVMKHFKAVEAYLLAYPEEYCSALHLTTGLSAESGDDDDDGDADCDNKDHGLPSDGGSHPRDFYGIEVNGVYGGTVNIGDIKTPKPTAPKQKQKPVNKKPGWKFHYVIT